MKQWWFLLLVCCCLVATGYAGPKKGAVRKRIAVVSSYHPQYHWSQETNRGFCDAMLKFGYFDNRAQAEAYTKNDYIETSKVIVKKIWMDAKRRTSRAELMKIALEKTRILNAYKPDILFLGDDEAGNYIGSQFLDAGIPVVFWGFNNNPVKYGLVDTADRPGHNVTGVYQSGYYRESLLLLKRLVPRAKTFAILTDDSPSGRAHRKAVEFLARKNLLPIKLVASVETNNFELWKAKAVVLQEKVDAFFVTQYSTLRDEKGNVVSDDEAARWYLAHIKIPEAALGFFVKQGLLCGADDSGYKQAYQAVVIGHDILNNGANPATYRTMTPSRGPLRVNRDRAKMLGISLDGVKGIEEYVDRAEALKGTQE